MFCSALGQNSKTLKAHALSLVQSVPSLAHPSFSFSPSVHCAKRGSCLLRFGPTSSYCGRTSVRGTLYAYHGDNGSVLWH